MTVPSYTEEDERRCDCSCHRCCVPMDAWCEDCEEDHADTEERV